MSEPAHPQNQSRTRRDGLLAGADYEWETHAKALASDALMFRLCRAPRRPVVGVAVNGGEQLPIAACATRVMLTVRDEQLVSKFRR